MNTLAQAARPEIVAPHMTPIERQLYEGGHTEVCKGFIIVPKNDFGQHGYWMPEHRCCINAGWVVTYGSGKYRGCNAAPGAVWAKTLCDARDMVDDLIASGHSGECNECGAGDGKEFHRLCRVRYQARRADEIARENSGENLG